MKGAYGHHPQSSHTEAGDFFLNPSPSACPVRQQAGQPNKREAHPRGIVKSFMKNRSGTYGKTRETLPLARGASACAARRGRERVGVKAPNGIAKTLKKQSIFPSP